MFLQKRMIWEHMISKGRAHPQDLYMIIQEKAKLTRALFDTKGR